MGIIDFDVIETALCYILCKNKHLLPLKLSLYITSNNEENCKYIVMKNGM